MKYAFVWLLGCVAPWAWKFVDNARMGDARFPLTMLAIFTLVGSGILLIIAIGNAIYVGWDLTEKKP